MTLPPSVPTGNELAANQEARRIWEEANDTIAAAGGLGRGIALGQRVARACGDGGIRPCRLRPPGELHSRAAGAVRGRTG